MKLASLKHGRDGKLVVVSKDITRYSSAEHIAPTMAFADLVVRKGADHSLVEVRPTRP